MGPLVVHVRDAAAGEVSVLSGESEVVIHDPAFVARIVAAAGGASHVREQETHVIASRSTRDLEGPGRRQHRHLRLRVTRTHPTTVTLITNYIPLQNPAGGPNFFEFGDDVSYKINVDNNGDGVADVVYEFRFTTTVREPGHVPLQHRSDRAASATPTGTVASSTR